MRLELSQTFDRPVRDVFQFIAADHVRNHPRWDPLMSLRQVTDGPMGVGTIIHRRHTHTGAALEGTMEVVEFEPDRAFGMVIRDGPLTMHSRMTFEPADGDRATITATLDIPDMHEPMDPEPIQRSLQRMKELIEA